MKTTKILTSLLISLFIFLGFNSVVLAALCPEDNGYSGCDPLSTPYYCTGSCRSSSAVPQCVGGFDVGTYQCDPSAPGCDVGCNGADNCGICNSCSGTNQYKLCSQSSSGAGRNCAPIGTNQGTQVSSNCTACTYTYSGGNYTYTCSACPNGYERIGSQCISATVKLGSASVSGTDIRQGDSNSFVFINNDGVSIGTSTIPEQTALKVIGSSQFTSALFVGTPTDGGHAVNKDYLNASLASSTGAIGFWSQDSNNLYTSSSTVNVGIGTTTPEAKLDVNGALAVRGSVSLTGALYAGGGSRFLTVDNYGQVFASSTPVGGSLPSGSLSQTLRYGASGWESTSAMIINSSSNIGIGTTTPSDKLHVYGNSFLGKISGYPYKSLWTWESDNTGYYSGIGYQKYDGTNQKLFAWWRDSIVETNINTALNVATPGNTFNGSPPNTGRNIGVKLSSSGNSYFVGGSVGFGTTSPNAAVHIVGNAIANPPSEPNHLATKSYVDTVAQILWIISGNNLYTSSSTVNVGIGTTTPEAKLDVNGPLAVRGSVSLTGALYAGGGSRLLTVDNYGNVAATSTVPGGGNYVSKAGDNMSGTLHFDAGLTTALNLNDNDITGVNKLSVVIIDPLYNIGGTKYSTYAPSVVGGAKEEYLGRGEIVKCGGKVCSWRLDFSKVDKGSDLWVWRKIIEFSPETVDVVMTAYGQPALLSYEIEDNQLIFYSDRPTKFSYRLVGSRFDWRKWPTLANDQSEETSLIIE